MLRTMKLRDKPGSDKPRERLLRKGSAALSNQELLEALIGRGNRQADVTAIAKQVRKLLNKYGADIAAEDLFMIPGVGQARVCEILAAFELSRRYLLNGEQPVIDSTEKALEQLSDIRDKQQEYFVCLTLDGANRLIAKRTITIGTLTSSLVHPREVFADAITDRAASIIVAHNHPSGRLSPSDEDIDVTEGLLEAGKLLGITVLDHLIVTKNSVASAVESL